MIQLARQTDDYQNPVRPGWTAETVWASRLSQCQWPLAVLDEFLHWHTSHPNGRKEENIDSLHTQLPGLSRFAADLRLELIGRTGVVRIAAPGGERGNWDESAWRQLYWVSGLLMGSPLDAYGKLYEVKDHGSDHRHKRIPVSQTSAATSLHTDSSSADIQPDLVGLLCLQQAREGGKSRISSALMAHEVLRQTCPDLLELLYCDFIRDIVTPGTHPTIERRLRNRFPIFCNDPMRGLNFRYMRYWIETGQQQVGRPLTATQVTALDALEHALEAAGAVATFMLQPGEMLWLDNRTVAHDRTAYVDDPRHPRRLLRLWLNLPSEFSLRQRVVSHASGPSTEFFGPQ